jgi:hypothetical protein
MSLNLCSFNTEGELVAAIHAATAWGQWYRIPEADSR